ncbi:lytic transglycosylase domain-containing protein [Pandoraea sp.]|uniref:lytic transglycosylase domain-containing protein n=1 Tax=Pandoraea sp. TaxID=1883445 RepID=UPI0025F38605|nr:lytic transglycosylase domain-containing protein [Pandoraea sp.]
MKLSNVKSWQMLAGHVEKSADDSHASASGLNWRRVLRHSSRVSLYGFSVVGLLSVLGAVVLWTQPALRGQLAAQVAPLLAAATGKQAAPTPAVQPPAADADLIAKASQHAPSIAVLASYIPNKRIAVDARNGQTPLTTKEQVLVAEYLAKRYHVASDVIANLVKASYATGQQVGLDPLLLLAVMAIESGFNPYAESGVGAQGLMQVMSKVHMDKLAYFGGADAALHPLTNIKVGALILKECIARGGSLANGLRLYVGSTSANDGGYGAKVLAERSRLRNVALGHHVSVTAPQAPVLVSQQTKTVNKTASKAVQPAVEPATATPAAPQNSAAIDKAKTGGDGATIDADLAGKDGGAA